MSQTFDYMLETASDQLGYTADDNRLVQRFAWYSTVDPSFNGSLYESTTSEPATPPFKLTPMGENYLAYASNIQVGSEFKLLELAQAPLPATSGEAVSVTLRTTLSNAGNNQLPAATRVLFYWGDPSSGGVPIGSADVSLTGCGRTTTIYFVWADVPLQANGQKVYARLQAGGADTQLSTPIVLVKNLLFAPLIKRIN